MEVDVFVDVDALGVMVVNFSVVVVGVIVEVDEEVVVDVDVVGTVVVDIKAVSIAVVNWRKRLLRIWLG